jgi:hypothetical protein
MLRRLLVVRTHALAGVILLSLAALAQSIHAKQQQEQQTSQSQQQASQPQQDSPAPPKPEAEPGPKPKKVWTNDDVVSLRTPADVFLAEKEEQEAANAKVSAKKADFAKQVKEAGLTVELPSTAEETQRLIKVREDQAGDLQKRLDQLNHDLSGGDELQRATIQQHIETVTLGLRKVQLEVKVLHAHLEDLAKTAPAEPSPAPPPSPEKPQ